MSALIAIYMLPLIVATHITVFMACFVPLCVTYGFSQLIQGLIDGEEEFVKEMKTLQLYYLDSSRHVSVNILNQKEMIFRNIKDIVCLHER